MSNVASAIKDPMLRFNTGLLNQNVEERVRVMAENGQIPLAYLTAKSNGLEEMAATLEEVLQTTEGVDMEQLHQEVEKHSANCQPLTPLRPVF
jgi:coatomer protein complex subunit alpha (xenin)